MALVVLLRGINVGGHRPFRPAVLARQLRHLDAVNVGAAGTLVIRRPIGRTQLRAEIARRLPFAAQIVIVGGREIARLMSGDHFAAEPERRDVVRFVSVLARRPRATPPLPVRLPARGKWLVQVLATEGRLVLGVYRRHMKTIGCLGRIDDLYGVAASTRSWSTIEKIARVMERRSTSRRRAARPEHRR